MSHRRKQWFQFSLRGLLLAITLAGCWLGRKVHESRNQFLARTQIAKLEGSFCYRDPPTFETRAPSISRWLRKHAGEDLFQPVQAIGLGYLQKEEAVVVTNDDFATLVKRLPHLKSVTLCYTQMTDEGMKAIGRLRQLKTLTLFQNASISADGVEACTSLHGLRELHLYAREFSADTVLESISKIDGLRTLVLESPNCTDDGLKHISKLESLETLRISSNGQRTTNDGLLHLAKLKGLKELELARTDATPAGIELLEQRLPTCKITVHVNASSPTVQRSELFCLGRPPT